MVIDARQIKIAVFGTGYVGLSTAVSFSEMGHEVIGVDLIETKVQQLTSGSSTIFEPGLQELLVKNLKSNRLRFSANANYAISNFDVIFICVGTPTAEGGITDLSAIYKVIDKIADFINGYKLLVIKSTVPVGTLRKIRIYLKKILQEKSCAYEIDLVSNPEFLREGTAIQDCLIPYRIIVGTETTSAPDLIRQVYLPLTRKNIPLVFMDAESAEMSKYVSNCLLATKISLMNEFSRMCEKLGADIELVKEGVGLDKRIGPDFISAGLGYGGSCFPKDVESMIQTGKSLNEELKIITAVYETNAKQKQFFINKIESSLKLSKNICLALWGTTFKPNTDDIREAPSLTLIKYFLSKDVTLHIFDPVANQDIKNHFNSHPNLIFFKDQYEALKNTDALVIATEWPQFLQPDFELMKSLIKTKTIFDGRNIYSLSQMKSYGFSYHSVGRKAL